MCSVVVECVQWDIAELSGLQNDKNQYSAEGGTGNNRETSRFRFSQHPELSHLSALMMVCSFRPEQ